MLRQFCFTATRRRLLLPFPPHLSSCTSPTHSSLSSRIRPTIQGVSTISTCSKTFQWQYFANHNFFNQGHSYCKHFSSVSDHHQNMAENKYLVGYAKLGTSSCKKCKQKIDKGALRIAKLTSNPFSDDAGEMKQWFHPQCIFESFQRARATTKKIEEPDDVEGFSDLQQEDKDRILKLIKGKMKN